MKFYEDGQVLTVEQVERDWTGLTERWAEFKAHLQSGDELRWFMKVDGPRAGRFGFVIVRPGPSLADPAATEHRVAGYLVGMA